MADAERHTSMSLALKRTDTDLMPPPPAAKRIQRPKTVLDEDTYTDGLSKIIARDFFPGLLESEAQSDYLNALESKDAAWIASAGRRLRQVMTPGSRSHRDRLNTPLRHGPDSRASETPGTHIGDTPGSVISTTSAATTTRGQNTQNTNMSLASYQAKYTSEDNESFYKLLDKQNQKRAEKHAWLYNGNKLPSKMQLKQKEIRDRRAASGQPLIDDGFAKRGQLAIQGRDDRPAAPDSWKTTAKNALIFGPEDLDGSVRTVAEKAQADSRAPPKTVVYANTRLHDPSRLVEKERVKSLSNKDGRRASSVSSRASGPPSPTMSAVRDAISGRLRRADADSTAGSTAGNETPRVNGYAFVDDESGSVADPDDAEPAISLSDLGRADATPGPFQLQGKSRREDLHHRMVDRIKQNKRTAARVGMTGRVRAAPATPVPTTPRLKGNLTPAGQRLWSSMTGGARAQDAVSAFNRRSGDKDAQGSRRARLQEMNAARRR